MKYMTILREYDTMDDLLDDMHNDYCYPITAILNNIMVYICNLFKN